jgi:serine protease DegS
MPGGQFGRTLVFIAGSIVLGLACAFIIVAARPEILQRTRPLATLASAQPAPQLQPVSVAPAGAAAVASEPLLTPILSYATAVEASAPAVVNIYTAQVVAERVPAVGLEELFGVARPQYRQRMQQGLGSGVIVDALGHIVTNHHVVANAVQISVQLADGRTAQARAVGGDPDTDLAVLQIDMKNLPVMSLGRSDQLRVGDVVLAIGSPLGLSQTVTHGIVSATGRAQLGVATFESFIQTDAAINVGNSGGALVNTRGELIGINTAVLGKDLGAEGIGVAIPVDLVRGVMREILDHGRVIRGWIGIIPEDVGETLARQIGLAHGGVVISNVYAGSPAAQAALQRYDIVERVNDTAVRSAQDTLSQIAARKPGEAITLALQRGARRFTATMRVIDPSAKR